MTERPAPPDDELVLDPPDDVPTVPVGPAEDLPPHHPSFDAFWAHLGLESSPENLRLRELFHEWLGQQGYDVHRRDEPTVIGDLAGWQHVWSTYLSVRRLK